jgi:hypothetical protein
VGRLDYLLHILDLHDYLARYRASTSRASRTEGDSLESLGEEAPLRVLDMYVFAASLEPCRGEGCDR